RTQVNFATLASISWSSVRNDLSDRLLVVDLQPISPGGRRLDEDLDAAFHRAHPAILGGLLTLASRVLATLPTLKLEELPRMASYARVLAAVDELHGTDGFATYAEQVGRIASDVLDSDVVTGPLLAYLDTQYAKSWTGTMEELLTSITPQRRPKYWPMTAKALGATLRRLAPAFLRTGVEVAPPPPRTNGDGLQRSGHGGRLLWHIRTLAADGTCTP
ncbi:MAG: hypothetical protein KJ749_14635, partial [Planctomycetes bacterium]|nr:hypothetical protein [Planctomycetota bacterium]